MEGYNLGQIKLKIKTIPPPHFNDGKMARFTLRAKSSLILGGGGGGGNFLFYSVQDSGTTHRFVDVVLLLLIVSYHKDGIE